MKISADINSRVCPTEESGFLMSSLYKEINALCAGVGVREMQGAQRQLTFKQGTLRGWGICRHEKGIASPSKLLFLANSKYAPT
jgi:hypothetical protein